MEKVMMQFDDKKVVGELFVPLKLTEDDIATIVSLALNGGIGYWAGIDNASQPSHLYLDDWVVLRLLEGGSVKMYDREEEEDDSDWVLTLDKLVEGYKMNYINRPFDRNVEVGDAITGDCIFQYALFGKIVFG